MRAGALLRDPEGIHQGGHDLQAGTTVTTPTLFAFFEKSWSERFVNGWLMFLFEYSILRSVLEDGLTPKNKATRMIMISHCITFGI